MHRAILSLLFITNIGCGGSGNDSSQTLAPGPSREGPMLTRVEYETGEMVNGTYHASGSILGVDATYTGSQLQSFESEYSYENNDLVFASWGSTTTQLGLGWNFHYASPGELSRIEYSGISVQEALMELEYEQDNLQRISYSEQGTSTGYAEFVYEDGFLSHETDVDFNTTHYEYSEEGLLEERREGNVSTIYGYDSSRRVTRILSAGRDITISYDSEGRINEIFDERDFGSVWVTRFFYGEGKVVGVLPSPGRFPGGHMFDMYGRSRPIPKLMTFPQWHPFIQGD